MELSVREALSGITTVPDMVRAFQDEAHCRRLLEAMVWPTGRICPACGYRRSIAHRPGEREASPTRALPMLEQHLSVSVHRHDPHAATCDEASSSGLAVRPLADAAVGQGHLVNPSGGGARRQPADGLAHGSCPAPDGRTRAGPGWCR